MQQMFWGIILIFILLCAIIDWKEQKVYLWILIIFFPFMLGYGIVWGKMTPYEWIRDLALGLLFLFLGIIWKEQIGLGDGLFMMMIGMVWDIYFLMWSTLIALIALALVGGCFVLTGRVEKDCKMPFIPFMAIGIMLGLIGRMDVL